MSKTPIQELLQAKTVVRKRSRDLIQVVFKVTELFPPTDQDNLLLQMRKKALSISSFVSHGTSQSEKKVQADNFLAVMHDLRELLKLSNTAYELKFVNAKHLAFLRVSISDVIKALDNVSKLMGSFDE